MNAKTILAAILAMKDADRLGFMTPPTEFAQVMHRLSMARIDMERELGRVDVQIEDIPA